MAVKVRFNDVSKQYQLGLTRTSLPALLRNTIQGIGKGQRAAQRGESDFWALRHIDFELHEGESLALVGANGAGKTTMLKLLAKITKPTSGSIKTDGKLSALIELGAGFHPDLTGRENVFLNGAILGISRQELIHRFDEIVSFAELENFIDTPVKRYSSGMVVRLGFAVASCIEPAILLVDEVLAVGDALFQEKCMRRIRTLLNQGTTIIFVSHNFYLIQAICRRALYLEKGQVKLDSSTKDVLDRYEQDLHQKRIHKLTSAANDPQRPADDEAGMVEITQVEVLDADGERSAVLSNKQGAEIRIHYQAYQPIHQMHVSVFIMRADGLACCMMRTKVDETAITVKYGRGVISVFMEPLQLITGAYYAEAWFLNESDAVVITPKGGRSAWFQVRSATLSYGSDSGIFTPNSRWQHECLLDAPPFAVTENGVVKALALGAIT